MRSRPISVDFAARPADTTAHASREVASIRARIGGYVVDMVIFSAIAMVMQYWVQQTPGLDAAAAGAEHIDKALPARSNGTFGNDLKEYLEAHGFSAYVFDGELADLRNHLAKGRPIVVCLGLKGPDAPLHYVVVVGIGDDEVLLNDPARGKLFREKAADFLRAWKVTENWALLAVPRQTR